MRGEYKNKAAFFLCVIMMALMMFKPMLPVNAGTKEKPKTTLVIGDSIARGMALGKNHPVGADKADKVYWLTEGGVSVTFLYPDFKIQVGKVMPKAVKNTFTVSAKFDLLEKIKEKKIEDIVIMLGANWPGEKSGKLIVECLKKLAKESGCRVYYVNPLPYVHKGRYRNRTNVMAVHNKVTKEGFEGTDIKYIDAYGITKKIPNYSKFTSDGIHYSKKVYNAVFNEVLSRIEKEKEKAEEKLAKEQEEKTGLKKISKKNSNKQNK